MRAFWGMVFLLVGLIPMVRFQIEYWSKMDITLLNLGLSLTLIFVGAFLLKGVPRVLAVISIRYIQMLLLLLSVLNLVHLVSLFTIWSESIDYLLLICLIVTAAFSNFLGKLSPNVEKAIGPS